jgi:hypothetical protein
MPTVLNYYFELQSGSDNRKPDNWKISISERKSVRISNKKAAILFPRVTDIRSGYRSIHYQDQISVILGEICRHVIKIRLEAKTAV